MAGGEGNVFCTVRTPCISLYPEWALSYAHRAFTTMESPSLISPPDPSYEFDSAPSSALAHATAAAINFGIPRKSEIRKFSTSHRNPQKPLVSQCTWAKSSTL